MKWITIHEYVDMATGEITRQLKKDIIIISKKKKHERKENAKFGVTTITNYYRESKWRVQEINFYTTSR